MTTSDPQTNIDLQNIPGNLIERVDLLEQMMTELQTAQSVPVVNGQTVDDLTLWPDEGVIVTDPTSTDYTGGFACGEGIDFGGTVFTFGYVKLGVIQWGGRKTDAAFVSGGGVVTQNINGINILAKTSGTDDLNALTFADEQGDIIGGLYGDGAPTVGTQQHGLWVVANELTGEDSYARVAAIAPTGKVSDTMVEASINGPGNNSSIELHAENSALDTIIFKTGSVEKMRITESETVINEAGTGVDSFRVESNNDANLIKTDPSNDNVGIGTATPNAAYKLDVNRAARVQGALVATSIETPLAFGDGSDGDVTASTGTLTKDMNYRNLTVPAGVTLSTAGFTIRVSGTLTVAATGVIDCSGGAGGAVAAGNIAAGAAGGTAPYTTHSIYGIPGAGGTGEGTTAIGTANSAGKAAGTSAILRTLAPEILRAGSGGGGGGAHGTADGLGTAGGNVMAGAPGGAGGTATGAGNTSRRGAGGGAGGGVLVIYTNTVNNAGAIQANGGAGGNGFSTGGDSGGNGGGGGGGAVIVFYRATAGSGLGTRTASAGNAGTGGAGGANGTAGTSVAYQI